MHEGPQPQGDCLRVATNVVAFTVERDLMNEVCKAGMARAEHVLGFFERWLLAEHQAEHSCLLDREGDIGLTHGDNPLKRAFAVLTHNGRGAALELDETARSDLREDLLLAFEVPVRGCRRDRSLLKNVFGVESAAARSWNMYFWAGQYIGD